MLVLSSNHFSTQQPIIYPTTVHLSSQPCWCLTAEPSSLPMVLTPSLGQVLGDQGGNTCLDNRYSQWPASASLWLSIRVLLILPPLCSSIALTFTTKQLMSFLTSSLSLHGSLSKSPYWRHPLILFHTSAPLVCFPKLVPCSVPPQASFFPFSFGLICDPITWLSSPWVCSHSHSVFSKDCSISAAQFRWSVTPLLYPLLHLRYCVA